MAKNKQTLEVRQQLERIRLLGEYSQALTETIQDNWSDIQRCSNEEESAQELTFYEVQRLSRRMEVLLSMLNTDLKVLNQARMKADELLEEVNTIDE